MSKKLIAAAIAIIITASTITSYATLPPAKPESDNKIIIEDSSIEKDFENTQHGFPMKVRLNDHYIKMTAPTIVNTGNTLVPIRDLAQALGFTVDWNAKESSVIMKKDSIEIWMQLDNTIARVNSLEKKMPAAPVLISNKVYVPVRFTAEIFNLFVTWDRPTNTTDLFTYIPFVLDTSIGFDIVKQNNIPVSVKNVLERNLGADKEESVIADNSTYFILTMAQKPTAGYAIEIADVRQLANQFIISAKHVFSPENDITASAETNPHLVIRIPGRKIANEQIKFDISKPRQGEGLTYKILEDAFPKAIQDYLDINKGNETQFATNVDNRTYVVLTMGEQRSGGYYIELNNISLKDSIITIDAKYHNPGQNDIVTMAVTYPALVIKLDDIYEDHYEIKYDIEK